MIFIRFRKAKNHLCFYDMRFIQVNKGNIMKKFSRTGKTLIVFGTILFVWGCGLITNTLSFGHINTAVSFSVLIVGIVCCIASNFFKQAKS